MTDLTVAHTIMEQLGGRKFVVMTGARQIAGFPDGVRFRIGGGARNSINLVQVTLTPMDVYEVEFYRYRPRGCALTLVSRHEGVYCDQLRSLFEEETGFATSLGEAPK